MPRKEKNTPTAPNGKQVKFSEPLGKATLLQFWATTCNPSKLQNKELKELFRRYKIEGLEIIAISRDLHKEDWVESKLISG
ncbi:peroxiredoxin family protein [Salegentibacter sp. 24]|uniref:peroxiredoxin family protein n=1 Tax=Salegentibacter sp. 24 TaxID=2183986 RepID=UPI00105F17BC|nr:TlpA disulfide reductase family protein [Salegentibacter sp. 24]